MQEVQRKYNSPLREQQASETRTRILEAAKKMLAENGYARTTIDGIAREAVVSPQTVYATFRNKRNIFTELILHSVGSVADELFRQTVSAGPVRERLRMLTQTVIRCNTRLIVENGILRSAGILSPELARIQKECADRGRQIQRMYNAELLHGVKLREGLSLDKVLDVIWYLTQPEGYQTLVLESGWTQEEYADWLYRSVAALLDRDSLAQEA